MDALVDVKVTAISGARATIIRMGIEMIMEMVFKRGAMIRCDISVVKSVDEILPRPMDFMLLGSVILSLSPCHLTMTIGSCHERMLVLQL